MGMRLLRLALLTSLFASLVFHQGGTLPSVQAQRSANANKKITVDNGDKAAVAEVTRRGGILLVDYGAFGLWSVPASETASVAGRESVTVHDEFDTIELRGGVSIDTKGSPPTIAPNLRQTRSVDSQLWLVQFVGPIKEDWLDDLGSLGFERVMYMPQNAYVIWGNGAALARLDDVVAKSPVVQFSGEYHPAYRLEPSLRQVAETRDSNETISVTVQFYTTKDIDQSVARLRALGGLVHRERSSVDTLTDLSLEVTVGQLTALAHWADVFNVEPYVTPRKLDEAQGQIIAGNITTSAGNVVPVTGVGNYLAWLASKGFPTTPASYPIMDVIDDGIDNGTATPLHPDFYELGSTSNPDRLVYNQNCTTDATPNGVGGHGNINAAIVGAFNTLSGAPHRDASGFQLDLGVAPHGRLAGTKIFRNSGPFDISACGNTIQGLVQKSFASGANITSNSWGANVGGAYNADSRAYDSLTRDASTVTGGNQQMLHIFAAGNAGSGSNTIGSPGTAKNVLTVGATENVRDEGIVDGCGISAANNADDLATFSSRGPTDDNRVKPDIMAPGTHVQGAASMDPGYNGSGVCGAGSAPNRYYPTGQTLYTWSSGTSHSTPGVAGAASLIHNAYGRVLNPGQTPSPAMLKALILNSSRYLAGAGAGGSLPTNNQGWGDVNVGTLLDGAPRFFADQNSLFTASGQTYTLSGTVADTSKVFRVTLAWTDAPGSTTGNAFVNDLNLEVTVGGNTYKGNVFSGATSTTGGTADARNNVESVYLPAGTSGPFTVRVIAQNIAGDGVPGNASALDQDFALVISNAAPRPLLTQTGSSTSDAGGNNNGAPDPGESLTLQATMKNEGNATATSVSGVLAVIGGGATIGNGNSAYPNITSGASSNNATPYSFAISPSQPCGSLVTLRHTVSYNGSFSVATDIPVRVGSPVVGTSANHSSTDVPKAIPDNNPSGVFVNLPISGVAGEVSKVNVRVNITHTFDGDLLLQLISPTGTTVTLSNRRGGGGDNFTNTVFDDAAATAISSGAAPFTGSFRPETPLASINGEIINGTWQLKVSDLVSADVGSVTAFSLDIVPVTYQCAPAGPLPGITVSPSSGLVTTEAGGQATFTVKLDTVPTTNVTIPLLSSDLTEGTVSPGSLVFTPANALTPQTVVVTGVDDNIMDGDVVYTIQTQPAQSTDPNYTGRNAADVSVTNRDIEENVGVGVGPLPPPPSGGPALSATLTARPSCGAITSIQFGNLGSPLDNAVVAITAPGGGPSQQTSGFLYTPPAGTMQVSLMIQRAVQSGGATVNPVKIRQVQCTEWQTFVGGGPAAWGSTNSAAAPSSTSPPAPTPVAPTPTTSPVTSAPGSPSPTPGAACAQFSTHAAAQAYLRANPTDPLLLDGSRNGIACEGADGAGLVNPPLDTTPVPRP